MSVPPFVLRKQNGVYQPDTFPDVREAQATRAHRSPIHVAQQLGGVTSHIDLAADAEARRFIKNHVDAKEIIQYLSISRNTVIDSETLLIFDEIQECLPVITALKYFCQEYRDIPVIATGSMVRIRLKQIEESQSKRDPEIETDMGFPFSGGKSG